jgi:ankyrin repeat protein
MGFSAIHYAARGGRCAVIALLAARGADINAEDDCLSTPLHIATTGGHDAAVAVLLEIGAKTNKTNDSGYTPLHCAVMAGETRIARRLLACGAAPDARDLRGRTALQLAEDLADEGKDRSAVIRALHGGAAAPDSDSTQVPPLR